MKSSSFFKRLFLLIYKHYRLIVKGGSMFKFPQTNQTAGKLRPALVIRNVPGQHGDGLILV